MSQNYLLPLLFTFCFFISSAAVHAQHTIEGKVMNKSDEPVPYANVILLNAQDSTSVVKGAVSSEAGIFKFEDIAADDYLLKISFVGYEELQRRISINKNEDLGNFELAENGYDLDEVAISVKNPTITRKVDRLVFNVANTSLSSGSSWDILRRTPGVLVINGGLQVRNQGVEVYINDRKVHLTAAELRDLLENYSAENIESIEVITTPPARYDAEGGSILNIVTSRGISTGYKGSLNTSWTQAIYPKYSFGTSHYYKTDKLNVFANYSFNPRKEFKEDDSYINFREDGKIFSRWETDFDRTTRSQAHNANVILDYTLDDRNTLSFSSNVLYSPDKTFNNEVFTEISNFGELPNTSFLTESSLEEDQSNIGMDLEYRHSLETEGAEISAKGHYTRYDQDRFQEVATNYEANSPLSEDNSFFTEAQQHINIYTGQLDYVTPIGSTSFETGVKTSIIASESGIDFYDVEADASDYNPGLSDNFLYDENIYAGYLSMAKEWENWSVKGGLRGEFTQREGDSRSMDQVDEREYFEMFPTFYLLHNLSANNSLTFDYSRRIQRPRYESLNPFRYFLNEHNYNAGNPNLNPAISNNFNLNFTLQNSYFFDLYYRDNGPSIDVLSFQDNQNLSLRSVSVNLLESISYGLDFTHGRSIAGFWYAYGFVSLFHEEQKFLALESGNVPVTNEIDAVYAYLSNSFTLSADGTFSGELGFTYVSDYITGSYNFDPMTTLSIGLRKTLWNNRAELTLNLEDILDKTNTRLTSRYLNQDNSFYAQPESRYVRVGFKYNFGNFRLSDNQRDVQAEERDRL